MQQFNLAVSNWTRQFSDEFSNSSFSIRVVLPESGIAGDFVNLHAVHTPDIQSVQEQTSSDLDSYVPTHYEVMGLPGPAPPRGPLQESPTCFYPFSLEVSARYHIYKQSFHNISGLCLVEERLFPGMNWKVCRYQRHGTIRQGSCVTVWRLADVCLTVELNASSSTWQISAVGCDPLHPSAVHYVPYLGGTQNPNPGGVIVRVRDVEDPYITAERLTEDTLYFGATPRENVALGIAFLVIAGLLALPSAVLLVTAICGRVSEHRRSSYTQRGRWEDEADIDDYDEDLEGRSMLPRGETARQRSRGHGL